MVWQKKAASPAAFNIVDALISAIHNDPVYGWMEHFAHLMPADYIATDPFCVAGPLPETLVTLTDLIGVADPMLPGYAESLANVRGKLWEMFHNRLFSAMCELSTPLTGGWNDEVCVDVVSHFWNTGAYVETAPIPAGATLWRWHVSPIPAGADVSVTLSVKNAALTTTKYQQQQVVGTHGNYSPNVTVVAGDRVLVTVTHGAGGAWTFSFCSQTNATSSPWVGIPQPAPSGLPARVVPPVAALADLSPLLFEIENKLSQLVPMAAATLVNQLDTGVVAAAAVAAPANTVVAALDWIGFVVTLANVPVEADVNFGTPQMYSEIGRISIQTAEGWYPPIPITVSPMVFRPMPPGAIGVSVTCDPPATATLTPIKKS